MYWGSFKMGRLFWEIGLGVWFEQGTLTVQMLEINTNIRDVHRELLYQMTHNALKTTAIGQSHSSDL